MSLGKNGRDVYLRAPMGGRDRIGKYRVERVLGSGGFATVWLAHDDDLDDLVAIKVLAENYALQPDIRRRFVDEARIMRRLDHDSVVRVYAVDQLDDGRPYFVMAYADGGTLGDRLNARRRAAQAFTVEESLSYTLAIVDALGVVHANRLVHRDIKPSNILFRRRAGASEHDDLRLMLGDFGLAKDVAAGSGFTLAAGTPDYMAPEQRLPTEDIDQRADLYAVVAVLFELATGQPPHRTSIGAAPSELVPVLARGLKPDRDARFQSGAELTAALVEVRDRLGPLERVSPTSIEPPPPLRESPTKLDSASLVPGAGGRSRRRIGATAAAVAVVLASAGAAAALLRDSPSQLATIPAALPNEVSSETTAAGSIPNASISADAADAPPSTVTAGSVPNASPSSTSIPVALERPNTTTIVSTTPPTSAAPATSLAVSSTVAATSTTVAPTTARLAIVPRLIGKQPNEAQLLLQQAGLVWDPRPQTGCVSDNIITSQDPPEGSRVPFQTPVKAFYCP